MICEHHEDYLVLSDDGRIEAVSVKHRADTSRRLVNLQRSANDEGELGHLLNSFGGQKPEVDCCFESNRGNRVADVFSEDPAVCGPCRDQLAEKLSALTGRGRRVRGAADDRAADAEPA